MLACSAYAESWCQSVMSAGKLGAACIAPHVKLELLLLLLLRFGHLVLVRAASAGFTCTL